MYGCKMRLYIGGVLAFRVRLLPLMVREVFMGKLP